MEIQIYHKNKEKQHLKFINELLKMLDLLITRIACLVFYRKEYLLKKRQQFSFILLQYFNKSGAFSLKLI